MDNSNNTGSQAYSPQPQPQLPSMGPQMPQVSGVANPPIAPAPSGSLHKNRVPLIFAIVAAVVIMIAIVVAVILFARGESGSETPKTAKIEPTETVIEGDSEDYSLADIDRNGNLMRLVAAAESYQLDHDGKLPFGDGVKIGEDFVKVYIEKECETTVDSGKEARFSYCPPEFSDFSDRGAFFIVYNGSADGLTFDSDGLVDVSSSVKDIKGFYAYSHVYCGGNGRLLKSEKENALAVLGKLTTGEIICQDNH